MSDDELTDVMFRRGRENDVFALFPGIVGTIQPHTCLCFQHIGQHSSADLAGCVSRSRPAQPLEYADLKQELEQRGYKLRVVKRATRDHYKQRCEQLRESMR